MAAHNLHTGIVPRHRCLIERATHILLGMQPTLIQQSLPRRQSPRIHRVLMRSAVLIALAAATSQGVPLPPRPSGPIADHARVISPQDTRLISAVATSLWEQAGFALVVAALPSIGEIPIEEYAVQLYASWGIGKEPHNEGALILISLEPRRARIEVGYGAEGYINDARAGRMLDNVGVPLLRQGDFSGGLRNLAIAIAEVVAEEKNIQLNLSSGQLHQASRPTPTQISPLQALIILILLILLVSTPFGRTLLFWMLLSGLMGGRRRGYGAGGFGGGFGNGGFGGGFGGGISGGGGASRGF